MSNKLFNKNRQKVKKESIEQDRNNKFQDFREGLRKFIGDEGSREAIRRELEEEQNRARLHIARHQPIVLQPIPPRIQWENWNHAAAGNWIVAPPNQEAVGKILSEEPVEDVNFGE